MKWIKVEDELPQKGALCLLKKTYPPGTTFNLLAHPLRRCHIVIGGLRYDGKFISYEDQYSDGITVSHWMYLVNPPENENVFTEWGGSLNAVIDGKIQNVAEHLNELEGNK